MKIATPADFLSYHPVPHCAATINDTAGKTHCRAAKLHRP